MQEYETVTLENGLIYLVLEEKNIGGTKYVLLSNINDDSDICFRKIVNETDGEYFVGIDGKDEFQKILLYFSKDELN